MTAALAELARRRAAIVDRLAHELFSNPLIEQYELEALDAPVVEAAR